MITIALKEVAQRAVVRAGTVSNVLNRPARIATDQPENAAATWPPRRPP
jgi:DNA-binding LacI/PurR family transcriptional regulator